MKAVLELANSFADAGDSLSHAQPPVESQFDWLNSLRSAAIERTSSLSLPTTQDEDWRFTDLSALRKHSFETAFNTFECSLADIDPFLISEAEASRLVFINGIFAPQFSSRAALPDAVTLCNLTEIDAAIAPLIAKQLGHHGDFQHDYFCANNTAQIHDAAVLIIPANISIDVPVHLLFIASSAGQPLLSYPRCLLIAQPGSQCTVIEDYLTLSEDAYLTNAVTEITVGENAQLRHIKLQRESRTAFHIAHCAVALARDSHYHSSTISLGARISRHDLRIIQNAENTSATLDGLALIGGRQVADTHTTMDHAQPHGHSTQLHKCILDNGAHAVFNGKVLVREGAQLTDSAQSSRNLLLSNQARVDTKPQLEIFADDVKCAHGATVGQLDAEELFYLKSRGLDEQAARNLLTYAFAAEIIDTVPVASLKTILRQFVLDKTHAY